MSPKAEKFLEALGALCREHGVQITTSGYDHIDLWDLKPGKDEIYGGIERVRDHTEKHDA